MEIEMITLIASFGALLTSIFNLSFLLLMARRLRNLEGWAEATRSVMRRFVDRFQDLEAAIETIERSGLVPDLDLETLSRIRVGKTQ